MFEGLFQPLHLLVIFAIALFVFGPKKLPELGKGIGEGRDTRGTGTVRGHARQVSRPSVSPVGEGANSRPVLKLRYSENQSFGPLDAPIAPPNIDRTGWVVSCGDDDPGLPGS
jgi:sec-independent protein translocase protein TatA